MQLYHGREVGKKVHRNMRFINRWSICMGDNDCIDAHNKHIDAKKDFAGWLQGVNVKLTTCIMVERWQKC